MESAAEKKTTGHVTGKAQPTETALVEALSSSPDSRRQDVLERAVHRERKARKRTEELLEQKRLELYQRNQKLEELTSTLEKRVAERTRELELARDEALVASQAKSQFLANMSHEMRTPLNGVLGVADLLLDTEVSEEQQQYLDMMRGSADALLVLINDILDFSKIEVGRIRLEKKPFRLRQILGETLKALALRAEEKGLELLFEVDLNVPEHLVGDGGRLRQVVVSLLGNAIKFTERGAVGLRIGIEDESRDGAVPLHFTVWDTGIGIPPEKQKMIFEAFWQIESSHTRRFGGTGLGLAISARLVSLMGGHIHVESRAGEGSRFHFSVPFEFGAPYETSGTRVTLGLPSRILLAEDNRMNQRVAASMLKKAGYQVDVANDGGEAILRWQKDGAYDLLLLDLQMPVMSGLDVARKIREKEASTTQHLPIIALTANALKGDRKMCLEAGMDDYLAKPIRRKDLLAAIKSTLEKFGS